MKHVEFNTCNPQNRIRINFDQKGIEIVHLWLLKYTLSYEKGCPLATTRNHTFL